MESRAAAAVAQSHRKRPTLMATPPESASFMVRPAAADDVPAIAAIYAYHVETGTASFELAPPTVDEMRERFDACIRGDYPYLVADRSGHIVGYAYAGPYRARPAYRHTAENSVYVD